ncbi:MAG: hypothetical protein ACE5IZ_11625, partial [Dehalococcoidia bacterium]
WDAVGKMMRVIGDCSGFAAASDVYDRHRDTIERYREARNHLEHFDERLPGGKRVGQLAIPSDLGNLSDGVYSFGGKSWDVTPSSLAILEEIVDEFNSEIRSESIARHRAERESTS